MKVEMKAPSPGESITEVRIANWIKKNGDAVREGENVLEIDSDKATLEVVAPASGKLVTQVEVGATIAVGTVVAFVDTDAQGAVSATPTASAVVVAPPASAAATSAASSSHLSPAVKKMVDEKNLNPADFNGSGKGGRLTKGDLLAGPVAQTSRVATTSAPTAPAAAAHIPMILKDGQRRVTMTTLRAKIAERLKQAQNNAAILTTFNEVDLASVNEIRKKHKDSFKAKHGVGLGYMSFFTRACVLALKEIPEVNAFIDGNDLIYNDFINVGVAVGSDRGLVVPVLKGAQNMTFVDIEKEIARLAGKARDGKLSIPDMSDGTFTISNGGTYGSLLSTPILNPPQSGILGMHKIMDRPIVVDGAIQIRPMMYLALSYDHRLIDGKGAVTFLVKIKERLEKPEDLGLDFL